MKQHLSIAIRTTLVLLVLKRFDLDAILGRR